LKEEIKDLKEARDFADVIFAMWHLERALSYLL